MAKVKTKVRPKTASAKTNTKKANTKDLNPTSARVNTDTKRIDTLKELYRSVPMQLDFERVRIMKDVYEENVGYQQIIKRSKFLAAVLDRKKIYIDDNLTVRPTPGRSITGTHVRGRPVRRRSSKRGTDSVQNPLSIPCLFARSMSGRAVVATSTTPWFTRKVLPA
jgi:hypothetical protein